MRVVNSGNVGIGTTTPSRLLTVNGPMRLIASVLPGSPVSGDITVDNADGKLKWYNGSGWQSSTSNGYVSGDLNMASSNITYANQITNPSGDITLAPTVSTGAVKITSGAMSTTTGTGALIVTGGVGISENLNVGSNIKSGALYTPFIYGGTVSSQDLTLESTTNGAKGRIILAPNGGNVGIGTTAPIRALQVASSAAAQMSVLRTLAAASIANGTQIGTFGLGAMDPGTQTEGLGPVIHAIATEAWAYGTAQGAAMTFNTAPNGSTARVERIRIDSGGNVGIGTTSPAATLETRGTFRVSSATTVFLGLSPDNDISALNPGTTTTSGGVIEGPVNASLVLDLKNNNTDDSFAIRYSAGNTAAVDAIGFVMKGDGRVGIGTTTPVHGGGLTIAPAATASGNPSLLTVTAPAPTNLTRVETTDINFNLARVVEFRNVGGVIANQRAMRIQAPTYTAIGPSTVTMTNASTLSISGPPTAGVNAIITNPAALIVESGNVGIGTSTPTYALTVSGDISASGVRINGVPIASAWTAQTTGFTASSGGRYLIDTTGGAFTMTLPASPSLGDSVTVIDAGGTFNTNNLTVGRNSQNIMGLSQDMTVSTQNISFELIFYNATKGWRLK